MEGCVEGALEAQASQLNLGKGEVVVMSFVSLMWNRMVMVTITMHCILVTLLPSRHSILLRLS